jgi:hypothetical protein
LRLGACQTCIAHHHGYEIDRSNLQAARPCGLIRCTRWSGVVARVVGGGSLDREQGSTYFPVSLVSGKCDIAGYSLPGMCGILGSVQQMLWLCLGSVVSRLLCLMLLLNSVCARAAQVHPRKIRGPGWWAPLMSTLNSMKTHIETPRCAGLQESL